MAEEYQCPVCGKVGIPDYLSQDTTCPCCGSDLSIFRVIDQLPQTARNRRNIWKPIAAVAIVAAVVMGSFLTFQNRGTSINNQERENISKVESLQDSISILNAKLDSAVALNTTQNNGIQYVVKKGDSFWSISRRIYGTGTRYEEIATANGLDINSPLHQGDTIIVK